MLVTGGPPVRRGGGMPQHHHHLLRVAGVADHGCRMIGKHAWRGREVADIAVHAPEEARDGGLACGDAVEVAH